MAFSNCQYNEVWRYGCFSLSKRTTVNRKLKISSQKGSPARLRVRRARRMMTPIFNWIFMLHKM